MRHRPLDCDEVKTILKNLGFTREKRTGTSHEQWGKVTADGNRYKVTVDCPKSPFSSDLITYMARQAGVSKSAFYGALDS